MPTFRGDKNNPANDRYGVVVSRYNQEITGRLLEGALQTLKAAGVAEEAIDIAWVPGAFEIPLVADRMAAGARYAAVLCLRRSHSRRYLARSAHQSCRQPGHYRSGFAARSSGLVRRTYLRYGGTSERALRRERT